MAHTYIYHTSITIHFLLSIHLPSSWAGWLSSTRSVRYTAAYVYETTIQLGFGKTPIKSIVCWFHI